MHAFLRPDFAGLDCAGIAWTLRGGVRAATWACPVCRALDLRQGDAACAGLGGGVEAHVRQVYALTIEIVESIIKV